MSSNTTRLISFYLPQFHPIKENNEWWGMGFTEWTNVASASPRFKGHYQPHIPADLGFYDLRLEETRLQQAELASAYGIHGFCYYHYWFNGRRLLSTPLDAMLHSGQPDFPFCLCWANENWTRAWDGLERQVLIGQNYSEDDNRKHITWLTQVFHDKRYITIDNRPLLLVYRVDSIPDVAGMVKNWREQVKYSGFDGLYLCAVKSGLVNCSDQEILGLGFDAVVDFQPNRRFFPSPRGLRSHFYSLARKYLPHDFYQNIKLSVSVNNIVDYGRMVEVLMKREWPTDYVSFPCVFPSWDNSPRRRTPTIIQNDNPSVYGKLLADSINKVSNYSKEERVVFINAWNEWAEGCHLEPDRKYGHAFLDATYAALRK